MPPPLSFAKQVLQHAQSGREVIQDFCPLAESLEWELGQQYLRERGNKAFISDASPVPFVINNDGSLSRQAAEVLFANLLEAEKAGTLESEIFVLELGIGVGLFARFFLDAIRDLCAEHKKDFYYRLTYVAADKSKRMLLDVLRHGVLANHPGRVKVRPVDAMEPEGSLPFDAMFAGRSTKPFRAVFLNYLLDCLPAAVLEIESEHVKQLCVRTCVARGVRLSDSTDLTPDQLRQRAASKEQAARDELLEVYGLFASEYDYRPVDVKTLPHGAFALEYGRRTTKRLLHSYGAMQSLDKLLDLVVEDGFILINDYGQTQASRDDEFEHQRFSLATFVGVNFPLLRTYYSEQAGKRWIEPAGDSRGIHSRLLGHRIGSETTTRFFEQFSDSHHEWLQEPLAKARLCAKSGRFELAATYYRDAIDRQPGNWVLLNEVSTFLTFQMRDPKSGMDMAKATLALNPTCSAELWNTLGDGLYEFGRTAEARSAYLKALAVNASDVRSRYNLGWVYAREKNFPAALASIAEAMAYDKTGEFRDRLLQKLQDVLAQQAVKHQQDYLLLINLVSRYAPGEKKPEESPPPLPTHSN
ncbi:MAG: tetratricopeptide repeat protein [Gemmataceae bacterium]|nr:tetratricopeptide repeat protein [Gemmataceae bacterium]